MTLIQQALAVGWSAQQILNYISRKVKGIYGGIQNSRKSGYTDEDILKFLQGKIKSPKVSEPETAYGKYLKQSGLLTKDERDQRRAKGIKSALQAGGTALSAYAAYQAGNQFAPQLQQILGIGQGGVQPTAGTQPGPVQPPVAGTQPIAASKPIPQQPSETEPPSLSVAEQQPLEQEQTIPEDNLQKSYEIIVNSPVGSIFENTRQELDPQTARKLVQQYYGSSQVKTLESQSGKPFEQLFDEYKQYKASQSQDQGPIESQVQEPLNQAEPTQSEPEKEVTEQVEVEEEVEKPIERGSTVLTKDGNIATVEELPGKSAKISVDGKKRVVNSNDLINLPVTEEELVNTFDNFKDQLGGTFSNNASLVGYDEDEDEIIYNPHDGPTYVLRNVPQELKQKLFDVASGKGFATRKTTGENFIGGWTKGTESPIGAVMNEITQYMNKKFGKDKSYIKKYTTIYAALGELYKAQKNEKKKRKSKTK